MMRSFLRFCPAFLTVLFAAVSAFWGAECVRALDTVLWKPTPEAECVTTAGRVLVVAQDRSLLIQDRTGEIFPVETEMLQKATRNSTPFVPMTQDELAESYIERLPKGFESLKTAHFVLFYKTSKAYARWNGLLLERLYDAFETFWTKRGLTLSEPEFPLFCIIFPNSSEYHAFADAEGESVGSSVIAYYSFHTNRIVCYDLSGFESQAAAEKNNQNFLTFTRAVLNRPNAEKQVATVIHEAAHQLSYNRGLAVRFGDIPTWYNEGIALFFESPNLRNDKGWSGIGRPNPFWLPFFKSYIPVRPEGQLEQLLANDALFQTGETVRESYSEAWTLTWFLIKTQPEKYNEFVRKMGSKPILIWDTHEERVAEFESIFGSVDVLEKAFIRYARKLRD